MRAAPLLFLSCLVACQPGPIDLAESDTQSEDGTSTTQPTGSEPLVEDPQAEIDAAVADLDDIVESVVNYYSNGIEPEWEDEGPVHLCPFPGGQPAGGEASLTPSLEVDCNATSDGLCVPEPGGEGPGTYDTALYNQNPVWLGAGMFEKTEPHAFHYNLLVYNVGPYEPFADCSFTARAHADLDDDGVFSTYERRGELSEDTLFVDPMLYTTDPLE